MEVVGVSLAVTLYEAYTASSRHAKNFSLQFIHKIFDSEILLTLLVYLIDKR